MIGDTTVGTNDLAAAVSFYDPIFKAVGIHRLIDFGERGIAWGVSWGNLHTGYFRDLDGNKLCAFTIVEG